MQSRKHRLGTLLGGLSLSALLIGGLSPLAQARGAHSHAKLSASQARKIALKKYPGKVEGKVKLENEEGSWQYAVNVRSGKTLREIMVNAKTGKIANVEVTTKAEEQKEAKAEAKAQQATKPPPIPIGRSRCQVSYRKIVHQGQDGMLRSDQIEAGLMHDDNGRADCALWLLVAHSLSVAYQILRLLISARTFELRYFWTQESPAIFV